MKGARLTSVRGAYWAYRAAACTQSDEQRSSGGMHRQSNAAGLRQRLPSPGPAWAAHRAGSFFAEGFSGSTASAMEGRTPCASESRGGVGVSCARHTSLTGRHDRAPPTDQAVRRSGRRRRRVAVGGRGRAAGGAGRVGQRQDDDPQDDQPADRAVERQRSGQRRRRDGAAAPRAAPADRLRVPAGGPVPPHERRPERGDHADPARVERGGHPAVGSTSCSSWSSSTPRPSATGVPTSCPAASSSAWGWPAPSPPSPGSCCSTSRSAPSTR